MYKLTKLILSLIISSQISAICRNNNDCKPGYICHKNNCEYNKKSNLPVYKPKPFKRDTSRTDNYTEIEPVLVPRSVGTKPMQHSNSEMNDYKEIKPILEPSVEHSHPAKLNPEHKK